MPTSGRDLTQVALSATLHCLTGCAIGEVLGMVIGTALGFSELGTVALAVGLAFLFGYALTSLPLLRAGMALSAVVPIALASDTLSIATMEIVDNAIILAVPGAMEAGLGSILFWGSLAFALVIAGAVALPLNRWLIRRGKGHAVVHETGIHGGPSPRAAGIVAAALAFAFGSAVLLAELLAACEKLRRGRIPAAAATPMRYDLLIIGMGSAGMVAAEFASRLGVKVAVAERDRPGGDCLWTGCVPSKALLASARAAHTIRHADAYGLEAVGPSADTERVWARIAAIQAQIAATDDNPERFTAMGVDVLSGAAELTSPTTVRVGQPHTTRYVLLATGSRPALPPIDGLADGDAADERERLRARPRPRAASS